MITSLQNMENQTLVRRNSNSNLLLIIFGLEIWLDYIQFERNLNHFERVNTIFWKAKKELVNPTTFISDYHLLLNQSQ